MGGIVDITMKDPVSKTLGLRCSNYAVLIEHVKKTMDSIRYLLKTSYLKMVVIFAGVCGADLNMYTHQPGISPDQNYLDQSVMELNRGIRHNNMLAEVPHPYFTSKVHKWIAGHCHHRYHLLFDGLYPSIIILKQWVVITAGLHQ